MNLLGWNLPTGNENVKGVGGGPGRDCCQNCPALQLQAWGPPAAPCSLGTDQGPLCRASTCSTTRGSCHPSSFGSARTIGTPLGVLLCVPSRGLQGCSHHALLPLLTHRSQGTEPAGHGPSFQICTLADSTHLPAPLVLQLDRWHRGIRGQQSPLECHLFRGRSPVLLARRLPWALPWVLFLLPSHPGSTESRRAQDPFCLQGISRPSYSKQRVAFCPPAGQLLH